MVMAHDYNVITCLIGTNMTVTLVKCISLSEGRGYGHCGVKEECSVTAHGQVFMNEHYPVRPLLYRV